MQLAPSKNPEKESKVFAILALVCGLLSLLTWIVGFAAVGFGLRAAILSKRVNNTKYLTFSIVGMVLGAISLSYYFLVR